MEKKNTLLNYMTYMIKLIQNRKWEPNTFERREGLFRQDIFTGH